MAGSGELEDGGIRASDQDRARVVEQLRVHCTAGRISVEELERRLGHAMSAQTVHELSELVRDLPGLVLPGDPPTRAALRLGPPGIRPFTYRFVLPSSLERTRAAALDTIATGLNGSGWELLRQTPASLEFRRTGKERIVIDLEPNGTRATTMIVHGRAPRSVRRQFAKLASQ
ncbi:MAG: DUF1707 domain-containing protein [Solirubrobacteraceae bacterium]